MSFDIVFVIPSFTATILKNWGTPIGEINIKGDWATSVFLPQPKKIQTKDRIGRKVGRRI
ncbi:hypothetical protein LEP1GSC048_0749 [Leptospira santarosai serovar Shermani str. 1342KT]|nr:hypothetical protein LEP1GSC040_0287 [Leptospira santarosai str. 2000030832]EPG82194.1 hypothetical protein LEP1GSC048_0749 [Leptospira santarosai serovar Shermani str. 1342KT]